MHDGLGIVSGARCCGVFTRSRAAIRSSRSSSDAHSVGSGAALEPGGLVPVPRSLEALVAERLAELPPPTSEALLCAALAWEPTVRLVGDVLGGDSLERLRPAVEADVIEIEAERLQFTHPLLAAAVQAGADRPSRRDMHRRLAAAVPEPEEQARHLAQVVEPPDDAIAAALDDAAHAAFERGAIESAAALSEQAVRFTRPTIAAHFRAGGWRLPAISRERVRSPRRAS